jgi:hypothetical protein
LLFHCSELGPKLTPHSEADLLYTKIQTGVENAKAQFTAAQLEAAEPVHDHDPAHNPHWRKDVRGKW